MKRQRFTEFVSFVLTKNESLSRSGAIGTAYVPRGNFVNERDAYTIPLRRSTTTIELSDR
jgi:hypothetical protein